MGLDMTKKILLDGEKAATSALRSLSGVASDLWGTPTSRQAAPAPAAQAAPQKADPPAPAAPPEKIYKPAFPPFDQLWKVADETVDWTEALVREHPTDALTSEHLWQFFRAHADAVLRGDMDAYLEVLETANPLGDLTPYARSFEVGADSADSLCASFEGEKAYMQTSLPELRRYLAGISLRVARDLMALLPVRQVTVYAQYQGENLLIVTFTRAQLQKVRFGFVDPEKLARDCGGVFGEMDDEAGGPLL